MPGPYYDPTEQSGTLKRVDRMRDLLSNADLLDGPYTGRLYNGDIRDWHDLTGCAADESPTLVVMAPTKKDTPATGGGPGVGQYKRATQLVIVTLVNIGNKPGQAGIVTAYRESIRLSDALEDCLERFERDPTPADSLWHQKEMISFGTRTFTREGFSCFISETLVVLHSQERKR